jgi:hypothetical protein
MYGIPTLEPVCSVVQMLIAVGDIVIKEAVKFTSKNYLALAMDH